MYSFIESKLMFSETVVFHVKITHVHYETWIAIDKLFLQANEPTFFVENNKISVIKIPSNKTSHKNMYAVYCLIQSTNLHYLYQGRARERREGAKLLFHFCNVWTKMIWCVLTTRGYGCRWSVLAIECLYNLFIWFTFCNNLKHLDKIWKITNTGKLVLQQNRVTWRDLYSSSWIHLPNELIRGRLYSSR